MATQTPNLGLTLPGNGEDVGDWDEPLNGNFTLIDTAVGGVQTELSDAASGVGTLAMFLGVSLNLADGTLKAVPDIVTAENTFLYGYLINGTTLPAFTLKGQLDNLGTEVWNARELSATLKDAEAARAFAFPNQMVSGLANSNGYPTYAGFTGASAKLDGSSTPIVMMINGYMARIRTLASLTIAGTNGDTYFIYATRQPTGVVIVDGSAGNNGSTSADVNSNYTLFNDSTANFNLAGVQVGDYLTLMNTSDAGSFLVQSVVSATQLKIVGNFPVGGLSGINYQVFDRYAVTLGYVISSGSVPANSLVVAEVDWAAGTISAIRPRCYHNDFIGEWRSVTAASLYSSPQIFTHYMGTDKLEVAVQVSQANDGSASVEELSLGQITNSLGVSLTNTLSVALAALGTMTPSSGTLSGTPSGSLANALAAGVATSPTPFAALTGTLAAAITGTVNETRSVSMKWDRNSAYVRGLYSTVFYTDYSGTVQTAGYIRVVARRRG